MIANYRSSSPLLESGVPGGTISQNRRSCVPRDGENGVPIKLVATLVLFCLWLSSFGCSDSSGEPSGPSDVRDSAGHIFVIDKTGKRWDVTYAKNQFGFEPEDFEIGSGPFSLRPILNPQMLSAGDEGYPPENATFLVMGTRLNGIARAYSIGVMSSHEVVNEVYGDSHVAVAY